MQDSPLLSSRPVTPPPLTNGFPGQPGSGSDSNSGSGSESGSPSDTAASRPASEPASAAAAAVPTTPQHATAPVGIGLYHVGINMSPLSPLRHQLSFRTSPGEKKPSEGGGDGNDSENGHDGDGTESSSSSHSSRGHRDSYSDDLVEDSKEILIDRLNDLVRHLTATTATTALTTSAMLPTNGPPSSPSSARPLYDGDVISALHARVDEMESVLAKAESSASERQLRHRKRRHRNRRRPARHQLLEAAPIFAQQRSTVLSAQTADSPSANDAVGAPLENVAVACDGLANDLAATLVGLTERSREFEQIQNALMEELAAARSYSAELEAHMAELEAHLAEQARLAATAPPPPAPPPFPKIDQTTVAQLALLDADRYEELEAGLTFLRLQLRGIEAQCSEYIPADADPELAESIASWKASWLALCNKLAEERSEISRQWSEATGIELRW